MRVLFPLLLLAAWGCRPPSHAPPKLVVLITVDGLRGDLLDRYDSAFAGGFRRMLDEGVRFTRAYVDHGITVSHAGHVTIATGRVPAKHGIVDAAFYTPGPAGDRHLVDAVRDTSERILGSPEAAGASPRQVLVEGLAEWVTRADPEGRAVSVGSGRYASLLHVYHSPAIPSGSSDSTRMPFPVS